MAYKTMIERIAEAQKKGTFEGNMLSQGKDIRWFNDEYFESKTAAEIAREFNNEEYSYYKGKITGVQEREGKAYNDAKQKEINDYLAYVEERKQKAIQEVLKKISHLPKPIRPDENRIIGDINKIIGQPMRQDDSWTKRLDDYIGVASTGEVPAVSIGGSDTPLDGNE